MKRVTGIGGIFFKCRDPEKAKAWYEEHLGIPSDEHGVTFAWNPVNEPGKKVVTVWSPFAQDTFYFAPSNKPFMINYRVEKLEALLEALREEGVEVIGEVEEHSYGKFAWIMDPEGNKIELWEPQNEHLE